MYVNQVFQFCKTRTNIINHSNHKDAFLQFLKIAIHNDINSTTLTIFPNKTYIPTIPLFNIIITLRILCQDKTTYRIVVRIIIIFDMNDLFFVSKNQI